ncbi:MAG: DUF4176 domain-containing protein [Clostridia bacterium]|nr:DUF4176 domain-containing protein [Clostridia bacterium]
MIRDLLPIGSVVLLRGGIKKLVIVGIKQANADEPDVEYDYAGVLYPEGYLGDDTFFLFNHKDINDIVYKGYSNPEREEFLAEIEKLYAQDND